MRRKLFSRLERWKKQKKRKKKKEKGCLLSSPPKFLKQFSDLIVSYEIDFFTPHPIYLGVWGKNYSLFILPENPRNKSVLYLFNGLFNIGGDGGFVRFEDFVIPNAIVLPVMVMNQLSLIEEKARSRSEKANTTLWFSSWDENRLAFVFQYSKTSRIRGVTWICVPPSCDYVLSVWGPSPSEWQRHAFFVLGLLNKTSLYLSFPFQGGDYMSPWAPCLLSPPPPLKHNEVTLKRLPVSFRVGFSSAQGPGVNRFTTTRMIYRGA